MSWIAHMNRRNPSVTEANRPSPAIPLRKCLLPLITALVIFGGASVCRGQAPGQVPPPPPPEPEKPVATPDGYTIQRDVNLVVLHVSVVDESGQFVPGLMQGNFRVFEDNVEQKISVLRQEDAPVSMGLVVDNSGSMTNKRAQVNSAALTFVQTSNPDDEVFIAHFNEKYFLDLSSDFTNDLGDLKKALEHPDTGSTTALYDAIISSLGQLKRGYRDKKVLLLISDGEDNSSRMTLEATLQEVQKSNALIYAIGLLSEEKKDAAERARKALTSLASATGGAAYFLEGTQDIEAICTQIARDIRHQYTLGYYPSKSERDGSFRSVRVEVRPPLEKAKLSVRTRTGYFAQRVASGN
jgi:Ca-activated chloride channel family protein